MAFQEIPVVSLTELVTGDDRTASADRLRSICHEVGFTSLGTFSRTFRSIMGESPVSYRRRSRPARVPSCFTMAWTRPASPGSASPGNGAVSEKRPGLART